MAKLNERAQSAPVFTHEGGKAYPHLTAIQQLRRSVASCFLWEDEFYEDGVSITDRIWALAQAVKPADLAQLAIAAREQMNLRHVPLLLLHALVTSGKGTSLPGDTIARVIQRADELSEFLAVYWRAGKTPLAAQVKRGLALAFEKFDEERLSKYNREAKIKLRDVLFLVHAKPKDEARAALYKRLAEDELVTADTWEVALSGGADKKETFERLIKEGKLGYLALLRNLRNMQQAGVDEALVRAAILARKGGAHRVLPFRFVAAARAAVQYESALDAALVANIMEAPPLPGKTVVLVDVSQSMTDRLSAKSDLTRMDAAATLASVIHGDVRMFSFSDQLVEVPPRRGMSGVDAIRKSQPYSGTALFDAVDQINRQVKYDRLIVITDEQATGVGYGKWLHIRGKVSAMPDPLPGARGYVINVASAKNGVGYGKWLHIDGFSESVIRFIHETEN